MNDESPLGLSFAGQPERGNERKLMSTRYPANGDDSSSAIMPVQGGDNTHGDSGTDADDDRDTVPTKLPVLLAVGFKAAQIKWGWINQRSPTCRSDVIDYVQEKRWAVSEAELKWGGFCTSLLAYEQPSGDSRKLIRQFYLDLDAEQDLERARREAVKAYDAFIAMGLHPLVRFSGSKGFGIKVHGNEFNDLGWQQDGHLIGKQLHHLIVDEFDLDTEVVDGSLWATRKLIAELNCLHPKTKLYAIPLTADELRGMPIPNIKALAASPRPD